MTNNMEISELTAAVVDREWQMFTTTESLSGRTTCQDDETAFRINRLAQIADWPAELLASYLADLKEARENDRNLVSEKYGHMMKWTSPAEYQSIEHLLPEPDSESLALIDQIVELVTSWEEETRAKYPNIAGRSRPLYSSQDSPSGPSVQTYLRGELETYSPKTIRLYWEHVSGQKAANINGAEEILAQIMKLSGYETPDAVEKALAGAGQAV
jgi:hypothetical protein